MRAVNEKASSLSLHHSFNNLAQVFGHTINIFTCMKTQLHSNKKRDPNSENREKKLNKKIPLTLKLYFSS